MNKMTPKEFVLSHCPNARVEKQMQKPLKNAQDHRWIIRDAWPRVNLAWGNTEAQAWKSAKIHVELELELNKNKKNG
jgi:hypothetical protein